MLELPPHHSDVNGRVLARMGGTLLSASSGCAMALLVLLGACGTGRHTEADPLMLPEPPTGGGAGGTSEANTGGRAGGTPEGGAGGGAGTTPPAGGSGGEYERDDGGVPTPPGNAGAAGRDGGVVLTPSPLVINEVMSQNDGAWIDEVGEADDWIELYNTSTETVELSEYSLVDGSDTEAALPALSMAPGESVLLWADNDEEQGTLHLPFKLSSAGDRLELKHLGETVAKVTITALPLNQVLARFPNGTGELQPCRYASPLQHNGSTCAPPEPPTLSDDVTFAAYELPQSYPAPRNTVQLSELSLRPQQGTAYLELLNPGSQPILLSNLTVELAPHAPHLAWPALGAGAPVVLPDIQLEPGAYLEVPVSGEALAPLRADPNFEGVATVFDDSDAVLDRVDFMRWPEGSALARLPDNGGLLRFCINQSPGTANSCEQLSSRPVGDRLRHLRTPGDRAALAQGAVALGVETTKFIVDLNAPGLVHLLSAEHWALHYAFVRELIHREPHLDRCIPEQNAEFYQGWVNFSQTEYFQSAGRRFLLGTLSHHSGANIWAIEHAIGDAISADQVATSYFSIIAHTWNPRSWVVRPQTEDQVSTMLEVEGVIPLVGPNAPFRDVTFQGLTEGVAYGTLRFIPAEELDRHALGPSVIVVTDDVPNDIPLVGGLITESFQTPLAHVNVLSQNRGTPNAALKDARTELAEHFDQLVRLEVTPGGVRISPAEAEEAAAFWQSQAPSGPLVSPRIDTSVRGVQPLERHDLDSIPAIGAKASQMATLARVQGRRSDCSAPIRVTTPENPFAVPVVHYLEHFAASGAQAHLEALKAEPEFVADPLVRADSLQQVRQLILEHPVDPILLGTVEEAIASRHGDVRVRFRSSSNTEDLPKFNGAGLYTSVSAELGNEARRVDDALRTVWSSLWNARAYDERSLARIDDSDVAMGVLVHPAFLSESANGVAVSRNVLDPSRGDVYYINAQAGEASVTNPAPGVATEQLIYRWQREPRLMYQSHSSLLEALNPSRQSVLSGQEATAIACALSAVHDTFRPLLDPESSNRWFAMEVEFKLLPQTRQLVVKQARPHAFSRTAEYEDCREN